MGIITLFVIASVIKNMYWPPIHYDTIYGYTLYGRSIAHEKTFKPSIIDENASHRFYYPPLVALNIALCNFVGINDKFPNSVYFILLIVIFYWITLKYTNKFIASLFTLLLTLTPEIYFDSSLSLTNLPAMVFASGGFLFLYDQKYKLSSLFFALSAFTRSESIIFIFVATLILMVTNRKQLPIHLLSYIPFIVWQLYILSWGVSSNKFMIEFSLTKLSFIIGYVLEFIFSIKIYGFAFILIILSFIFNRNDKLIQIYLLSTFVLFIGLYYFIDPAKMGCSLDKLMTAGFKRGMIYFIPIGLFYAAKTTWKKSRPQVV